MRILFDQGTPAPLRNELPGHEIRTTFEMGWSQLRNGDLLRSAQSHPFDAFITTDQNLKHQQNLANFRLAVLVLPTTSWPRIRSHAQQIRFAVDVLRPGDFVELRF